MKYYKVLYDDGFCFHGGHGWWFLPKLNDDGEWIPGEWMPKISGNLQMCRIGYHLVPESNLIGWAGPALFLAEPDPEFMEIGDYIDDGFKICVRSARLLKKIENWNRITLYAFSVWCTGKADENIRLQTGEILSQAFEEQYVTYDELFETCEKAGFGAEFLDLLEFYEQHRIQVPFPYAPLKPPAWQLARWISNTMQENDFLKRDELNDKLKEIVGI